MQVLGDHFVWGDGPELASLAAVVALGALLGMLGEVEEEAVVVVDAGGKLVRSEERVQGDYFERDLQHIGLLNKVGYYRFVLPDELGQPLEQPVPLHRHQEA